LNIVINSLFAGSGITPEIFSKDQPQGQKMHLKGYGWIKVFKTVAKDGSFETGRPANWI
jgi:hypothetical protein